METGKEIDFSLLENEFDDLVSLIYLGNYFSNGYKEPRHKNKSFEEIFLMICEKYKRIKEKKEPNNRFFDIFTYLHDKNLRYIDEYSDFIFYDLLAHKLADLKVLHEPETKQIYWYERFLAELQANGLAKIAKILSGD